MPESIIMEIDCIVITEIPLEGETIYDHIDVNIEYIFEFSVYKRPKEDCQFNRGNWIVDIQMKNGYLKCFKYPLDMTEDQMTKFIKPLVDDLEKFKKSKLDKMN